MNPEIKKDWTARAVAHQKADRFVQGTWLQERDNEDDQNQPFRGCFFGCMTQSEDEVIEAAAEQMTSPEWLMRLAEKIFEGLSAEEAILFPVQYMEAVPESLNDEQYEKIRHLVAIERMQRNIETVSKLDISGELKTKVITAIKLVAKYHKNPLESAESAARSAARSAAESSAWPAWSARLAAESAARSAAESAAWSAAWSARSAAWSAVESARLAAWSAAWSAVESARSAAWSAERDTLFKVFSELK